MHQTKKNYFYIDILINHIQNNNLPITALVVKNNIILGTAQNQNSIYIKHAEILAMQQAQKRLRSHSLKNCILYSLLEPCPMCFGYAINSHIKIIYYTLTSDKSGISTVFNIQNRDEIQLIKLYYKKNHIQKILSSFFTKLR